MEQLTPSNYHANRTHASKSWLDKIAECPKVFWHEYLNPIPESTPGKAWEVEGRALHMAVTEPELFPSKFTVAPKIDRRTIDGKAAWGEFMQASGGKSVLDADMYARVIAMTASLRAHPLVKKALRAGVAEQIFTWDDPATGQACKCMPDWMQSNGLILDLKTTEDVSPRGFRRSVLKFRYHVQEAFYGDGIREATGIEPTFLFAAVSKKPPYIAEVFSLSEELVREGRELYIENLKTLRHCLEVNEWPSYGAGQIIEIA